jgi:hypothetical protein
MSSRRTLLLALVAGVVALAGSAAFAAERAPQQGVGIRLLEIPTRRTDDPRAHLYVLDHLRPGATLTRRIQLSNHTRTPVRLGLYAAGADVHHGQFRFLDGRRQNELAHWTSVQPSQLQLQAGATASATVTINVPPAAAAGERYAVVWAELPEHATNKAGVAVVHRVGVRIYLSVGTGGEPPLNFAIESITAHRNSDGRPLVTAWVRNTGGRALDLSGTLRLTGGPGGLRAGPFAVQLGTTLGIGQTEPLRVPLDPAIPAGPWHASISLRSGTLQRTASSTITFPAAPGSAAAAVPKTPATAVAIALAIGGLVLLGVVALLRRRWRRGATRAIRQAQ